MPLGHELVTDGDFEADSSSWEWLGATRENSSPPPGGSGYYAQLDYAYGSPYGHCVKQLVDAEFGVLYEFDCNYFKGEDSNCFLLLGTNAVGKVSDCPLQGVFEGNFNVTLTLIGTTAAAGWKIDNVSLKEVLPWIPKIGVAGDLAPRFGIIGSDNGAELCCKITIEPMTNLGGGTDVEITKRLSVKSLLEVTFTRPVCYN